MGITPNPDILCNSEIKFKRFLSSATTLASTQCDYVATGHYVRRWTVPSDDDRPALLNGVDVSKDQSYFLSGVEQAALQRVLFPIGAMQKDAVREMARSAGLVSAARKDSYGICFIGERSNRPSVEDPTYYPVSRASGDEATVTVGKGKDGWKRRRKRKPRQEQKLTEKEKLINSMARKKKRERAAQRALPSLSSRKSSFANFMANYVDMQAQHGYFVDIDSGIIV